MAHSELPRDAVKCFVSEMLVDLIERNVLNGKEGLEPTSFFLNGVCLLVDISGFTKLSGDFCELGKAGIDELQLATNGFMGDLVEVIYRFGGDIIKFAGDAIICVFSSSFVTGLSNEVKGGSKLRRTMSSFANLNPGDEESFTQRDQSGTRTTVVTPALILRAMHCAAVLREVKTDKLTVHVGMSCGEMCFGILGGVENRWECLISGPCLHELSDCLDDAPSKTAVISAECGRILVHSTTEHILDQSGVQDGSTRAATFQADPATKYEFALEELPSGNHRVVSVSCSGSTAEVTTTARADQPAVRLVNERQRNRATDLIRLFVPVPAGSAIGHGVGLQFMAEIREVTTMFMKWDSYDASSKHRDLLSLQRAFYCAQEALQSTGAYLRQFLVDDKGCVLIACWGMPNLSYLDNASRALSAAARIRSLLSELHMQVSFGITTGDVYCGTVGSALRMEYAAIGSVVNMAARLMGKAHGGILIDDATYFRLAPDLKGLTKALDPIKVKGREEPLPVFSYDSIETAHVKEKVVEDHEISAACRDALLHLVAQLSVSNEVTHFAPAKPQGSGKSALSWFSGSEKSATSFSSINRSGPSLRMVIIKGKEGSGRTTAVRWLQHHAQQRQIPVYTVRISRRDCASDFFLWKRLFQLMVPKNIFVSNDAQRAYVKTLLDEIYPGNPHQAHHTGFPLLRSILGITCTFTSAAEKGQSHKLAGWLSRKESSGKRKQVHDFLLRVFSHLLKTRPSLMIIENIENVLEPSLKLLLSLAKVNVHAGIVLTALNDVAGGLQGVIQRTASFQTRVPYRSDVLTSSPWSKSYKKQLEAQKCSVSVTLNEFSSAEIDRMLCATLKVQTVPPEISRLVQDFSGGSYFWVREILQLITDYGAQQFMAAVDDDDSGYLSSDQSTRAFLKPKLKPGSSPVGSHLSMSLVKRAPSLRQMSRSSSARQLEKAPSFGLPVSKQSTEAAHLVQLNKLVLCRFGNLSSDEQRVLRTASVAGMDLSYPVLRKVLTQQLREPLADCLETLINQRWLFQDPDSEETYHFAHPHTHRVIYDLTPSSERVLLHQQVAEHMETIHKNDKTRYAQIAFQYQQCKSEKSLVYLVMAFRDLLHADAVYDFSECVDLLTGAAPCCKSVEKIDALQKLVDRLEVCIQAFRMDRTCTWVAWVATAIAECGCTVSSSAAVAPAASFEHFPHLKAKDPTYPTLRPALTVGGDCSAEERVKKMFLLQLSDLRAQLAADRTAFAYAASGPPCIEKK